ncbi:MAG: hypothetical protein L0I24_13510 [Pseudonocardia sp.]|nr:hypothetical protein [Pseudonocardia sp.]
MLIVRTVYSECANGLDCPELHELDTGQYLVRGYVAPADLLSQLGLPRWLGWFRRGGTREMAVIVSPELIKESRL